LVESNRGKLLARSRATGCLDRLTEDWQRRDKPSLLSGGRLRQPTFDVCESPKADRRSFRELQLSEIVISTCFPKNGWVHATRMREATRGVYLLPSRFGTLGRMVTRKDNPKRQTGASAALHISGIGHTIAISHQRWPRHFCAE
jgi:hypothetical protein